MAVSSATFRYGIDAYADWAVAEGVPIHEGMCLNMLQVDTAYWPRFGVSGAIAHFTGRGDYCSMFVYDIAAGASTNPVRHMYEEICLVLEGNGSTQLEFADGATHSFEWGPASFFAIPLNAKHRHFNASGSKHVRMIATVTAPLMMKLFHDDNYMFGNDYEFSSRTGKPEYYTGGGDLHMIRPGLHTWETNFVPDLMAIDLHDWLARGPGSTSILFALADSNMHAHVAEIAPASYRKAHRHTGGTHVTTLSGGGYSLLWHAGENDFERVDWEYGVVFPPLENQFHQHFVTTDQPSRYVATSIGGLRYPLLEAHRREAGLDAGTKFLMSTSLKDGGDQIEYEDQDSRIHRIWLEEMEAAGITPRINELGISV